MTTKQKCVCMLYKLLNSSIYYNLKGRFTPYGSEKMRPTLLHNLSNKVQVEFNRVNYCMSYLCASLMVGRMF